MTSITKSAILIAGPTASGKSALAMEMAERHGGVVINADSMQVYRELRVLTARPSEEDEARVPHALYGHVAGAEGYSAGRYCLDAARAIAEARAQGKLPVLVGGSGLYFKALLDGLSPVPEIPAEIRVRIRQLGETSTPQQMHQLLAARDPVMAGRLRPSDPQRILRALEVVEATGKSLAEWQSRPGVPVLQEADTERYVVLPQRGKVYKRCDARFESMMEDGLAVGEVRELVKLGLAADLPVMRALGVKPLRGYLDGTISRVEAIERAKTETRQFAKRQMTWLRKNMISWSVYFQQ